MRHYWKYCAILLLTLAISISAFSSGTSTVIAAERNSGEQIHLQLLSVNDYHGALESRSVSGKAVGGAAVLAAYMDEAERQAMEAGGTSIRVADGDLVGASPPISGLLNDEPTIEAFNLMKLRYSSTGNHEFDEGVDELLRLQSGGSRIDGSEFEGAKFQYLAANVVYTDSGATILPPYAIENVQGVKVGFIGVSAKDTPTIVTLAGTAGLTFLDEAEAVNRYVDELEQQGVKVIVVLLHQGGKGDRDGGPISGDVVPVVEAMSDQVDVVISGHSHNGYWGMIGNKLVTQSYSSGTAFADIELDIDPMTADVVGKRAEIVDTFHLLPDGTPVEPNAEVAAFVGDAAAAVAPIVQQSVGTIASALTRNQNAAGESPLGNLIADAQRWMMQTQIGVTNPGGIRTDVAAGNVTWGDLYAVQPFGNTMISLRLTGAQIKTLLEQQWEGQATPRMLQISGLQYRWNPASPVGSRVAASSITVSGTPLDLNSTYTIAANNFLADGGDNFAVMKQGTDRVVGPTDLAALVDYVKQLPQPFDVKIESRVSIR